MSRLHEGTACSHLLSVSYSSLSCILIVEPAVEGERGEQRDKAWLCGGEDVPFLMVISYMLSSSLFSGRSVRLWGDLGVKAEGEGKGKREAGRPEGK